MQGNAFTSAANLHFYLQSGKDTFIFREDTFTLGLVFYLKAGTGADNVVFEGNAVTGPAKVNFNLGPCPDQLIIRKSSFQETNMTVRGGTGMDRVILEGNTIAGPGRLRIDLRPGIDTFLARRNKLCNKVVLWAEPPPSL